MNKNSNPLEWEILNCIESNYDLKVKKVCQLPIGADFNTKVYHLITKQNLEYFLKLRLNEFSEISVLIPDYLVGTGIKQIIPPLKNLAGELWIDCNACSITIYPFIKGQNAVERRISNHHWINLGSVVKKLHLINLPNYLRDKLKLEDFHDGWRRKLTAFISQMLDRVYDDPFVHVVATFLQSKSQEILAFIKRAEILAKKIQQKPQEFVLCHADIHGWNLLIDENDKLYLIDWDTIVLAPKERDLMFIGAGIWESGISSFEEEQYFYQGYGQAKVDNEIICYYRLERIIQDIAEYCEHIFLSNDNDENKKVSFEYLKSNFEPNGTLAKAYLIVISQRDMR